ncbi:hypothetical protein AQ616_13520 [Oceanobacillus sp. E9]|uniref:hypothetical protein n=1 Tax=Oceanobacillus sp. E9 TaxID=1742575 RepID=UPI00084E4594|nr:hypothetical protein [Oceanobacillus sp. E9]OEH53515.1 hypothetical protein AQ616_13520 [Oceanobacillus sp. E9]
MKKIITVIVLAVLCISGVNNVSAESLESESKKNVITKEQFENEIFTEMEGADKNEKIELEEDLKTFRDMGTVERKEFLHTLSDPKLMAKVLHAAFQGENTSLYDGNIEVTTETKSNTEELTTTLDEDEHTDIERVKEERFTAVEVGGFNILRFRHAIDYNTGTRTVDDFSFREVIELNNGGHSVDRNINPALTVRWEEEYDYIPENKQFVTSEAIGIAEIGIGDWKAAILSAHAEIRGQANGWVDYSFDRY